MKMLSDEYIKNTLSIDYNTISFKVFIYILLLLFIGVYIWAYFGTMLITSVVPAVIRTNENISTITCGNSGVLIGKYYTEGQIVQKGDLIYSLDASILNKKMVDLQNAKSKMNNKIAELEYYRKSIIEGESNFYIEENSLPYKIKLFFLEQRELDILFKQAEDKYRVSKLMFPNGISEQELNLYRDEYLLAQINRDKYIPGRIVLIDDELDSLYEQINQLQNEIDNVIYNIQCQNIISPVTGIIESTKKNNVGDYMFSGEELARVIPVVDKEIKAELFISTNMISNIKLGQEVIFLVNGLSNKSTKSIRGNITFISSDAVINSDGSSYFIVEALLSRYELKNRLGEKVLLKSGMSVTAKVVLYESCILTYFISKIGLLEMD